MDWKCLQAIRRNKNLLVAWYLIYQYLLLIKGEKIISDRLYKVIRNRIIWEWEDITHSNKAVLSREDILCNISFSIYSDNYPSNVKTCANLLLKEVNERRFM